MREAMKRALRRLARAHSRRGRGRRLRRNHVLTVLTCVVAGFMLATSGIASRGTDLRPNRTTELAQLVREQASRNQALTRRLADARAEVDRLAAAGNQIRPLEPELGAAAGPAGTTGVRGPAVSVALSDAPLDAQPAGVDEEFLVVHQQDIQAVANALWQGGAEAMTIQGQRVTSRTGIKCVGNTVVLHGIPYAPPYVITAIGDQARLEASLAASEQLKVYRQYADLYRLGYSQQRVADAPMPPYAGTSEIRYATPQR